MSAPLEPSNTHIVLVVGNSRSGTTMMSRILGNNAAVYAFNELHFFEELWSPSLAPEPISRESAVALTSRLLAIQRNNYFYQGDPTDYVSEAADAVKAAEDPITPPAVFEAFLRYETARQGKSVACLQTPRNVYYLGEILALYPTAYAVVMQRDPRAILLSQKKRWKGRLRGKRRIPFMQIVRTWADYHPITIGLMWRSGIGAGDRFANHPRVLRVNFEGLLDHPRQTVGDICSICGITAEPQMLDIPQVGSSNIPDRLDSRGVDQSVADRWRRGGLSQTEVFICQSINRQSMQEHGYLPEPVHPNWLGLAYQLLSWIPKMSLALILNSGRVRNLLPAIKKRLTT